MELMTFLQEDALVGRLLDEGVLEDVLQLGDLLLLPDEFRGGERVEVPVEFPDCLRHLL